MVGVGVMVGVEVVVGVCVRDELRPTDSIACGLAGAVKVDCGGADGVIAVVAFAPGSAWLGVVNDGLDVCESAAQPTQTLISSTSGAASR